MSIQLWLIYLSVVLAVIATPGPSALLCMTHGAHHGSRRTLATVLGGIVASLTLMAMSALGLGAVLAASDTAFQVVKFAGAAYLVLLGIAAWRASPPSASEAAPAVSAGEGERTPLHKLFARGLLVGIGNPKDLLFFSALFPQFLDPSAPVLSQLGLLALTWVGVDGIVMFGYAAFGKKFALALGRMGAGRVFNRVAGGAFIAAGGVLAAVRP
ncbi:LysE family translocator [Ideonella sp. BN130291]|uniref:LysE family translocator n=1 Tax=Ideonella sp. BN130291 TaxID=3112940 RepID=UPI002E256C73|nr:LysE family transporter [Ideonella sp. BN130291]